MIELTKLNGEVFVVNAEHIEHVEILPNTSLILLSGRRFVVRETASEVIEKVMVYKQRIALPVWPDAV